MQTFVIIKPDAISRGLVGRIISRIEDADLRIIKIGMRRKNIDWARVMYPHLSGVIFLSQAAFITSASLIGMVIEGEKCVHRVHKMVGLTDSVIACPGTIRGDFGSHPIRFNCIHCSDSEEIAKYETNLFFNRSTDYE